MDENIKTKWVEALRSGKYKQAQYELEVDGAFCCLGVLCKVSDIGLDEVGAAYRKLEAMLGDYEPLVDLNDVQGKAFAEIAEYIEAKL